MSNSLSERRGPGALLAAAAGIVAALVAIGVAELVAGLFREGRSPVLDVGDRVIDLVPPGVKDLAISLFGTNDKAALLLGIGFLLVVFAATVGMATFGVHPAVGAAGIALFAGAGVTAVLVARDERTLLALLPSLAGGFAGAAALLWQYRVGTAGTSGPARPPEATSPKDPADVETRPGGAPVAGEGAHSRRHALSIGAGLTVAGVATFALGRTLARRFSAAASRAAVTLPKVRSPLADPGTSVQVDVAAVSAFYTPNPEFYRIDTALTVPQVDLGTWRLKVSGDVDNELSFSYDELLAETQIEADITLTCVSNEVGGDLLGTARWQGLRLDDLLERAGVADSADQVVGRSVDGYTCGFPTEVLDGRDALVALAMNGEPLPLDHGFPARLIVPGLYGYVSATKWLSEIQLTRFDRFEQYWVPRGYAVQAPIKTSSRIDTPSGLARVEPGTVMVAGVAWAQPRGIRSVQVRLDDGPWEPAELAGNLNDVTWRQWKWRWDATPGRHSLTVRAIDGSGAIQSAERSEPLPDGATGLHQIVVLVDG